MKLIKLNEDHYIVVDDSEIKEGDFIYGIINGSFEYKKHSSISGYLPKLYSTDKKITHSTQPLDERGYWGKVMPLTLTIPEIEELLGVVDVEKKAINSWEGCDGCDANDELFFINGYQKGYNQAIEDNKEKKYTEEDIRKTWEAGMRFIGEDKGSYGEFIQSLQPKTEWEVEIVDGKLKLL